MAICFAIRGIRYVQIPLCYPQERQQRTKSISIGPHGGISMGPVCVWDAAAYGGSSGGHVAERGGPAGYFTLFGHFFSTFSPKTGACLRILDEKSGH